MALSIGVSVGSRITVGGHLLQVKAAHPNEIVVSVDGNRDVVVDTDTRAEIIPDVFVTVGIGSSAGARGLAFEGPGAICIERIERPCM